MKLSSISTALENTGSRNDYYINSDSLDKKISWSEETYYFSSLPENEMI